MSIIRCLLGSLILVLDWVFTPGSIKRDVQHQAKSTAGITNHMHKTLQIDNFIGQTKC